MLDATLVDEIPRSSPVLKGVVWRRRQPSRLRLAPARHELRALLARPAAPHAERQFRRKAATAALMHLSTLYLGKPLVRQPSCHEQV